MGSQDTERKVCGEFPEFCYRAFDCNTDAEAFVNEGKFRLRCIHSCRAIEDESRRDPDEGKGHTREPGIVTVALVSPDRSEPTIWTKVEGYQEYHIESGNSILLFCTCLPNIVPDHMRRFGNHIVRINEPRRLAEDICDFFAIIGQRVLVRGCYVVYNKGERLDRQLTRDERADLAYTQKPARFAADCEFRLVVIKFGQPCSNRLLKKASYSPFVCSDRTRMCGFPRKLVVSLMHRTGQSRFRKGFSAAC